MLNFRAMTSRPRVTLRDYVRQVLAELRLKGISQEEVAERSKRAGAKKKVTQGYISQIVAGDSTNLSLDKLEGLAMGLGVPLRELLRVASGEAWPEDDAEFRQSMLHLLHERAKTASPEDKRFIERTIKNLLSDLEEGGAGKKAGSA